MSWSVNKIGKPGAVRAAVAMELARIKCSEPEESIKNSVASALDAALAAFPPSVVVSVSASGSQYAPDSTKPTEFQNNLMVKLDPVYGFVEDQDVAVVGVST